VRHETAHHPIYLATRLPCGAVWSMFICPRCHGRAQRLRLLDDLPAFGACVRASGLLYRSQSVRTAIRSQLLRGSPG
jgi:hypothetical protein